MSHQTLAIVLFVVFIAVTLWITVSASRQTRGIIDFYAGGRAFSSGQNGLAIGGDYMSAASFLGIAGIIALYGYDGFLYSIGFLVAWLVALLLVAEPVRNAGRFTMADVLTFRTNPHPVRVAAGVSTIVISIFYLLAQMVGAGALVSLLFGFTGDAAKAVTIVLTGALMIIYVAGGGMKGTTWIQIIKAFLLIGGALVVTVLVMVKFGLNPSALLREAAARSGEGDAFLEPGQRFATEAQGLAGKLDLISLGLALVLGTAGLPHILIRFYTVPSARDTRRSVLWGIAIIGTFYLLTLVLGFGAAALVGPEEIAKANPAGNTAAPQLAEKIGRLLFGEIGGTVLLAVIAAVAFATMLAVVAGLALATSSSVAHDLYAHVGKRGRVTERDEVRFARIAAFVIGGVAIVLSLAAQKLNVAFLVGLAFAMAASGNLPAILYSLYWKRFNTAGTLTTIYAGLGTAITLVTFSPITSGRPTSLFPTVDFHWFPLENPGIVSIPAGFFFGWLATVLSPEHDPKKHAELEVRALTGAGAERAPRTTDNYTHGKHARPQRDYY
ncbi:solute symporter family protein [Sphaerisporangium aureirubrum]|uniref:Cation acetate symporter n=1 Tax=Sphaerisporangium aureirubrum TaxID=1544736 RepID=A0ABW1NNS1_9ACTN